MVNSGILDIVIGLIFIYLLYSLLATLIQEIIATNFGFRAKILERAIFRMLEDETKFKSRFKSTFYLFRKSGNGGSPKSLTNGFYKHPLIKFLGENNCHGKPSYIDKETFSKVIVDLLRGDKLQPGANVNDTIQKALDNAKTNWGDVTISKETLSYLRSIWMDAEGEADKFRKLLEDWFTQMMIRVSGWYKRQTQIILFFVGLVIAITFNVDTLKIVDKLEKDPKLREQLVQQAEAFEKAHPDLDKHLLQQKAESEKFLAVFSQKELNSNDSLREKQINDSLELQNYKTLQARRDTLLKRAEALIKNDITNVHHSLGLEWETYDCKTCMAKCIFLSFWGWVITALALSLGAPFWFDLLNKLMKLRGSIASSPTDKKQNSDGTTT